MSNISDSLISRVYSYALEHYESSKDLYHKRNNASKDKIINDIFQGKLAEYKVYTHLREQGKSVTYPDLTIFNPNKKSYDADIICDSKIAIHVKSCSNTSAEKYGLSWCMGINDPIVINPQSNHWLALCLFNGFKDIQIVKWVNSKQAIYKPTKLKHKTKCAIYYNDISHL